MALSAVIFTQSGKPLWGGSFPIWTQVKNCQSRLRSRSRSRTKNTDSGVGVDSIEMTIDSAALRLAEKKELRKQK